MKIKKVIGFLLVSSLFSGSLVLADQTTESTTTSEMTGQTTTSQTSSQTTTTENSTETTESASQSSTESSTESSAESEAAVENHAMGEAARNYPVSDPNQTSRTRSLSTDRFAIGNAKYTRQDAIDVASYQSWLTAAHFKELKKLGIKATVVKTTENTNYLNPYAASQIKNAQSAGMKVSVYHFAHFFDAKTGTAEGKYAAAQLKKLGVEKGTRIFADVESDATKKSTVTAGLKSFFQALSAAGYSNHGLYTFVSHPYLAQLQAVVGVKNTWIAQYPYSPLKGGTYEKQMRNNGYGSWQFSSTAQFKGNNLDVSTDFTGLLTGSAENTSTSEEAKPAESTPAVKPQGAYHKYGKFVTVIKKNYTLWRNFNWKEKNATNFYGKTVEAKGYYDHKNGSRYLSLYDNQGKWLGYMNANGVSIAAGQQGSYQSYGKYVTVTSKSYAIWRNFSWSKKGNVNSAFQKTYQAKGYYQHFNGSRYLSIYDNKGKWLGYLNAKGAKVASGQQGSYQNYGKYVTVTSKSYAIWRNFSWSRKGNLNTAYHKTYQAKGFYRHFNGSKYLSLYDLKGKWLGYINEKGSRTTNSANSYIYLNAPYISQNKAGAPMGCEAASLLQALQLKGHATNYSLKAFLKEMPVAKDGDPNKGFGGTPYKVVNNVYQSIFAKPLAKWGNTYAKGKVSNISGASVSQLKKQLQNGNAVVVYVTLDFAKAKWGTYKWGKGVANAHIMTLDGYDAKQNKYHVSDPNKGKYWVSAKKFEAAYKVTKGAVVVK